MYIIRWVKCWVWCVFFWGGCRDGQTLAFVFAHHRVTRKINWLLLCYAAKRKSGKSRLNHLGFLSLGPVKKKRFLVRSWRPLTSSSAQPPVALSSVQISHQGTGAGPSTSGGGSCGTERDAVAVESLEPLWCVGWPQTVQVCMPLEAFWALAGFRFGGYRGCDSERKLYFFIFFESSRSCKNKTDGWTSAAVCSELGVSSVRERTFPLGPPNEDGMRNPDKRRWREVGERREGGGWRARTPMDLPNSPGMQW